MNVYEFPSYDGLSTEVDRLWSAFYVGYSLHCSLDRLLCIEQSNTVQIGFLQSPCIVTLHFHLSATPTCLRMTESVCAFAITINS